MSDEQPINETTPKEGQAVESGKTEAEPQAEVSSNSGAEEAGQSPTDKTVEPTPEWDAKTSYEALQKENEQVKESYAEIRREFTKRTQNEAELQRKLDNLTETINKATEVPIDPKQFFSDLQAHGPKAFDPIFAKRETALKQQFETERSADRESLTQMQFEVGKLMRRNDSTNYPDFQKLEPVMAKLVADEKISLNMEEGAGAVLDTLYKMSKNLNADIAIKEAKVLGRKEADAQSAKEANATVAGGGKSGPVTNPDEIKDIKELRKLYVAQLGEGE
jgi:hypothetical protein